jgi:hypothetical protein
VIGTGAAGGLAALLLTEDVLVLNAGKTQLDLMVVEEATGVGIVTLWL